MLAANRGEVLASVEPGEDRQDLTGSGMRADLHELGDVGIDSCEGLAQMVQQFGAVGPIADSVDNAQGPAAESDISDILFHPRDRLDLDIGHLGRIQEGTCESRRPMQATRMLPAPMTTSGTDAKADGKNTIAHRPLGTEPLDRSLNIRLIGFSFPSGPSSHFPGEV